MAINHLLGDIGTVSGLVVDRKLKRIKGALILTGEDKPVDIIFDGWELGDADNPNCIQALAITTTRPWLNAIVQKTIIGRWFNIPVEHMSKVRLALG